MTLVNPSYLEMCEKSNRVAHNVAAAWAKSEALMPISGNIRTDGQSVWSYNHVIAHTEPDGTKVSHDCHYSPTTSHHTGAIAPFADVRAESCHPSVEHKGGYGVIVNPR